MLPFLQYWYAGHVQKLILFCSFSVKGYLRKGNVLLLMKENQKASYAFQQAMEVDSNCSVSQDDM